MVLALLAAALFLLRRRVPIRRGTHLFSAGYPALRRGGATVVGFRRGRTQRTRARPAERHHDTRRADARPYPTWTSRLSPEACSRSPSSRIYLLGGLRNHAKHTPPPRPRRRAPNATPPCRLQI